MTLDPIPTTPAEIEPVTAASERQSSSWDIRNAPKNYIWLIAAQGITAFFSFASVWLITRRLGSAGYGGVVAFVAASQLVQIFLNWSITALARFGIEEFVETGMITRSFWTRTLLYFPNLVLVLLTSAIWLKPLAAGLKIPDSALWLVAVHIVTTSVWLHFQYALQGIKRLRLQGTLLAAERGLTFVMILGLILTERTDWEKILWCYILPPLIMSASAGIFLRPFIGFSGLLDFIQFRKMLIYSLPLIPFALVGYLATSQLDAIFITRYLSTRDLGIYAVAAQINGMVAQLPILANGIILSLFVSLNATGKGSVLAIYFKDLAPTLTLAWGLACSFCALIAGSLIVVIFGADFIPSSIPLWILLSSTTLTFPVLIGFASLSNAHSKTYISMTSAILSALANVSFNFLLIPQFGMIGCAWATLLSMLTSLLVFYFTLRLEGLLEHSWVLFAVIPAICGAIICSFQFGVFAALLACSSLSLMLGMIKSDSIRSTYNILVSKIYVKDVPQESPLR